MGWTISFYRFLLNQKFSKSEHNNPSNKQIKTKISKWQGGTVVTLTNPFFHHFEWVLTWICHESSCLNAWISWCMTNLSFGKLRPSVEQKVMHLHLVAYICPFLVKELFPSWSWNFWCNPFMYRCINSSWIMQWKVPWPQLPCLLFNWHYLFVRVAECIRTTEIR